MQPPCLRFSDENSHLLFAALGNCLSIHSRSCFCQWTFAIGFSTSAYLASTSGWLKNYRAYAGDRMRTGAEIVDYVAMNYSISPRLLLAYLNIKAAHSHSPNRPSAKYLLGFHRTYYDSPYFNLSSRPTLSITDITAGAAALLTEFDLLDKTIVTTRPLAKCRFCCGSILLLQALFRDEILRLNRTRWLGTYLPDFIRQPVA